MLKIEQSVLVVIDVQGKLASMMHDANYLRHVQGMMKAAKLLGVPIIITEQSPQKIGGTVKEIRAMAPEVEPIPKETFSCCLEPVFMDALTLLRRKQVIVTGIEAHVCVYQTVRELLKAKFEVYVLADAVSARAAVNKEIGLHRCQQEGAVLTTLEMTVTELLVSTKHPKFRDVMALLKENK